MELIPTPCHLNHLTFMSNERELITRFEQAGQGHVFRFWDELNQNERQELLSQAAEIDLKEIERLTQSLIFGGPTVLNLENLEPAPYLARPENGGDRVSWIEAKLAGEEALRAGKVAAFTVAGGQGTRLGFDGPKGTFPVTPVQRKSLFQVFAEKLLASERRYGFRVFWFIMTSHANHEATAAFFKEHDFFGLAEDQVRLFRQGRMPAVDFHGQILLESKSSIAMSPDGHGGSLRAIHRSGGLALMEEFGIEILSYFQVDNPLVRCLDPEFIGFHLLRGAEMSSKMLPKAYPKEKLGHFCMQNGKQVVIEYSDMPDELTDLRDADGQLRFRAGSIAIHLFSTAFIRRVSEGAEAAMLPFHRADKKIPHLDESGTLVKPERPNGVKFELFVFDALPFARHPLIIETAREDEFSPVKNADGVDSPKSCRDDQLKQFARWFHAAGHPLPGEGNDVPDTVVEVSPLFGYDADTFAESWGKLNPQPDLRDGLYLG
jgi:UDP-N-acetylglucosamine/UDP-N-acetylgalactosamine diphosphorylase